MNTAWKRTAPSLTMLTARKDLPGPGALFPKKETKPAHDLNKIPGKPETRQWGLYILHQHRLIWKAARVPQDPALLTVPLILWGRLPQPSLDASLSEPELEAEPESRWWPRV